MTTTTTIEKAIRYHDFSAGHRVVGHESKCALLHGHNYRVHFYCQALELDAIGRVIDFSAINLRLCSWLENHWDHKFLAWIDDELMHFMARAEYKPDDAHRVSESIVWVPFNPTAENMAKYLLTVVAPAQLGDTAVTCIKVVVEETRKCSATSELAVFE